MRHISAQQAVAASEHFRSVPGSALPAIGNNRAKALKLVLKRLEELLLQQQPGVQGTVPGCKMLGILQASDTQPCTQDSGTPLHLRTDFDEAIEALSTIGRSGLGLSTALATLCEGITWYSAKAGPYASSNFEHAHAHAALGISGGTPAESSVILGVTLMGRYTRFPDHRVKFPRVMFPLSAGQYLAPTGKWIEGHVGSAVTCITGRDFAMRSVGTPLMALWCQRQLS